MMKLGIKKEYDEEMQKAIRAGTVVRLTKEEIDKWGGGVHYITHFPVLKPTSESTKVRIVSDSKMKNNTTQLSFNDLIQDLPNALSELLVVIIRWRCHPMALMYDLEKAY